MIGILILSHGTFGESLIHCASHVMRGRPRQLLQIGVTPQDNPDAILPQALKLVRQLDEGDGVLVMSDIYGATPCNIARRLLIPGRVEGVVGVNLPMLIRALTYREEPIATVVAKAVSGGHEGVLRMAPEAADRDAAA